MDGRNNNSRVGAEKYNVLLLSVGWISAILSLIIVPAIFGVIGVISGILATKSGNKAGMTLIVSSIILMGIGLIFKGVIFNYVSHYLGI